MKYEFKKYQLVYVNDKYETKDYGYYYDIHTAKDVMSYLIENAVYLYGIIDDERKVLLDKSESPWIRDLYYIKEKFVEF